MCNNKRKYKKREKEIQQKDTTHTKTYNLCHRKFEIIIDARYSVTQTAIHLINTTTNPTDLPRKPNNLKRHNLCKKKNQFRRGLRNSWTEPRIWCLDKARQDKNFNISQETNKSGTSMLCKIQRQERRTTTYLKFYSKSEWEPLKAPKDYELFKLPWLPIATHTI